jgi:myo-inositol-1(or 4)-monophosphatase
MPEFLEVATDAAHRAGQVLLDWRSRFSAREKGPRDLVTEADLAAQEVIRGILYKAFPDHDFLGEEEAAERVKRGLAPAPPRRSELRWIVDPLDGTANYVHGMQNYAVSIALEGAGGLLVGCVYDPIGGECFTAEAGKGAWLNGQSIRCSQCESVGSAMIAVSFAANVARGSIEIARFVELLLASQSIRRLGSAALNLCYVAAGRLDGYVATSVNAWDIAAGALLLREAGGQITCIDGTPLVIDEPELLASASPALHREILALLATVEAADTARHE